MRALAVVAAVAPSVGCVKIRSADHPLVRAYLAAEPVTPTWNPDISPAEPMWSRTVELGDDTSVTVSARCCIGEGFVARYSDESSARDMFTPGDYVYATELRIAPDGQVVYGRVSGREAGIWRVTKLFVFDLERRELLQSAEVDPGLLPPVREPASSRPK